MMYPLNDEKGEQMPVWARGYVVKSIGEHFEWRSRGASPIPPPYPPIIWQEIEKTIRLDNVTSESNAMMYPRNDEKE